MVGEQGGNGLADLELDKDAYIAALEARLQGVVVLDARLQAAVVELHGLRARLAATPTPEATP